MSTSAASHKLIPGGARSQVGSRLAVAGLLALLLVGSSRMARADADDDFNVALKLYQSKRYDLAADGFADFIKKYAGQPRRPLAELYLGQSLMQVRKFNEARTVFSQFLDANAEHPDRPLAVYRMGECNYFLNEPQAAKQFFEDFLAKYADHDLAVWAWYYLGESRLQADDSEGAAQAFQQVAEKFPGSALVPEARFGLARADQNLKKTDEAIAAYRAIIADDKNPRAADALFNLGTLQFDARQYAEASTAFRSLFERFPADPKAPLAALNAGYSDYNLKHYDAAVTAFELAARSPEQEFPARLWIGRSRRSQERFADAVSVFKSLYEQNAAAPAADKVLYDWADSELRAGHAEAAAQLYVQLADHFPASELADNSLHFAVEASLRAGQLDQAETLHQRFVANYAQSGLAMLESLLHGRVLLAKAERLAPQAPLAPEATAIVKAAVEDFDRVLRESKIATTTDWARLLLGRARQMLGEHRAALETLQPLTARLQSASEPGEFAEALYLAGKSAAELKDWPAADAAFGKYVELNPRGPDAAAALAQWALVKVQEGRDQELDTLWTRFESSGVPAQSLAEALHAAAELSFDQERWPAAAALFQRLSTLPGVTGYQAIALSGIGHAEYHAQHYAEAAMAFSKLLSDAADDDPRLTADAAYMEGLSLDAAGQSRDAAAAYSRNALRLAGQGGQIGPAPADAEVAWNAYRCLLWGARAFAKADEIEPSDEAYGNAWTMLKQLSADRQAEADKVLNEWALMNYQHQRFERSDVIFQQLADLFPNSEFHDNALQYLAESLIQAGKFGEAESQFQRLLDDPASDAFVKEVCLSNLVELAARRADWAASGELARRLLALPDPTRKLAAEYRLGESQLRLNDFDAARETLARVRQELLDSPAKPAAFDWSDGVWLLLAEAELQARNYGRVDELVVEFHTRFPESKVGYQANELLGRSLIKRAEFEKAREAFQLVVDSPIGAKTETAARAQFQIAESFRQQRDYPTAIRHYYNVALLYDFPEIQAAALFQAGQCEELRQSAEGALKSYRELLEKYPESEFAAKARERMSALGSPSS